MDIVVDHVQSVVQEHMQQQEVHHAQIVQQDIIVLQEQKVVQNV